MHTPRRAHGRLCNRYTTPSEHIFIPTKTCPMSAKHCQLTFEALEKLVKVTPEAIHRALKSRSRTPPPSRNWYLTTRDFLMILRPPVDISRN